MYSGSNICYSIVNKQAAAGRAAPGRRRKNFYFLKNPEAGDRIIYVGRRRSAGDVSRQALRGGGGVTAWHP